MRDYLISAWEKHLGPIIDPLWESVIFWRSVSLIILTVILFAYLFRYKLKALIFKTQYLEHDKNIFTQADGIMAENNIVECLNRLQNDASLLGSMLEKIQSFMEFLNQESNQYLTAKTQKATIKLIRSLAILTDFTAQNFFLQGEMIKIQLYQLYPDLRHNASIENIQRYDKFRQQLDSYADTVRNKYKEYRSVVKQNLFI